MARRLTSERVLGASRIAIFVIGIALTVLLLLYCVSVLFGVTLWNVLKIFAVPITVGAVVPWLNWLQKTRELEVENQRAQDEALEAYLDQMSKLLLDKERPLRQSSGDDKAKDGANGRTVARARTLTALSRLDGHRKGRVVQFLYEADLVMKKRCIVELDKSDLREAQLKEVNLRRAALKGVDLRKADLSMADLREADLREADLRKADLRVADLHDAVLDRAKLNEALLYGAKLNRAFLHSTKLNGADLRTANLNGAVLDWADLTGADLSEADLTGADLSNAKLRNADLSGIVGWTGEQLLQARSLEGATMPNGQKYEDWIKSKDREEDEKKDGSS